MNSTIHLKTHQLHFLLGKWEGTGLGKFPTIEPFGYREELRFRCDGLNDLIHYEQRTWLLHTGEPSHWESGFIKPNEDKKNVYEINNTQDSGRVEVLTGNYKNDAGKHILNFTMKLIENDSRLVKSERCFVIEDDELRYIMKMTTQSTSKHQQHLQAKLIKIKDNAED